MTIKGTTVTAATFSVPMATIHSDKSQRDAQFGQVIGIAMAASLAGWLLLALLERRTRHARLAWTIIALAALAASLALPLAATTASATVGLIVMHLTVGAAVIPAIARTARAR